MDLVEIVALEDKSTLNDWMEQRATEKNKTPKAVIAINHVVDDGQVII